MDKNTIDQDFLDTAMVFDAAEGAVSPMVEDIQPTPAPAVQTESAPIEETPAAEEATTTEEAIPEPTAEVNTTETAIDTKQPEIQPTPEASKTGTEATPELDSNFYRVQARGMKTAGWLTEDLDVESEELTPEDIEKSFRVKMAQPIYEEQSQKAQINFKTQIAAHGWDNPEILNKASMLHNGIAEEAIKGLDYYKNLSVEKEFEDADGEVEFLERYTKDSEMSKIAASSFVEDIKEDEEKRIKAIAEAREWYKEVHEEMDADVKEEYQTNLKINQQKQAAETAFITDAVNSGKIGAYQMPPDLHNLFKQAMLTKNTPIEAPQGTVAVTPFEAFRHQFLGNTEYQIAIFAQILNASLAPTVNTAAVKTKWGELKEQTPASGVVKKEKKKGKKESVTDNTLMVFEATN